MHVGGEDGLEFVVVGYINLIAEKLMVRGKYSIYMKWKSV